ncbi:Cubilin [Halotydeus destructor]|nr:Cubilin [Halotydeus destructor]
MESIVIYSSRSSDSSSIIKMAATVVFLLSFIASCLGHNKFQDVRVTSGHRAGQTRTGTFYFPSGPGATKSMAGCDVAITTEEAWIFSPNYPSNYNDSVNCVYSVHRFAMDVCHVEILFTDFDTEDTAPQCTADYVDIDGVRMCGMLMPDTKKKIKFRQGHLISKVIFNADSRNNRKGFMAKVKQLRNSCPVPDDPRLLPRSGEMVPVPKDGRSLTPGPLFCDAYTSGYSGSIRSPNWPFAYSPNSACVYTFRRPSLDVCRVELYIRKFDLSSPYNDQCSDYLELPDRRRICGLQSERIALFYPKTSNYMVAMFKSGVAGAAPGFEIEVQQVPHSCGFRPTRGRKCDAHIKTPESRVTSPGAPWPYSSNEFCVYMIEPTDKDMCYFSLEFTKFDLGGADESRDCSRDYFQLPDGQRICAQTTGKRIYMFPKESNRIAMFYFSSDGSGSGPGFDITIKQISCNDPMRTGTPSIDRPAQTPGGRPVASPHCDKVIRDQRAFLMSPNHPDDYSPLSRCSYLIERYASDICQVRLNILSFDLEKTADCKSDYLLIESTRETLCGMESAQSERILSYPNNGDTLRLEFVSDNQVNRPGFKIEVEQIRDSCRNNPIGPTRTLNTKEPKVCFYSASSTATILSDRYPSPYRPETNCIYKLYRHSSTICGLELTFIDFSVGTQDGADRSCRNDYLEIESVRYCGYRKGETLMIDFPYQKEYLDMKFITDRYQDVYLGFMIVAKQVSDCTKRIGSGNNNIPRDTPAFCGQDKYVEEKFQVVSPGYENGRYKPFMDCQYLIKKISFDVCALEVEFLGLDIEESTDCSKDYLEIGDVKLCGQLAAQTMRTYEFGSDELMMKFHTDGNSERRGFYISVKQLKC